MRTSKKLLIFILGLFILLTISCLITGSLSILFAINTVQSKVVIFLTATLAQILIPTLYEKFYKEIKMLEFIEEFKRKPYKEYIVELDCQHCGNTQDVTIDLHSILEFKCDKCKKTNAIHVNIISAQVNK